MRRVSRRHDVDDDRNGRSAAAPSKKFYIYDTFTGFVPQYSSAADFPGAPQYLEHIDKDYRASDIESYVRNRFRNKEYVVVTKGVVPDILHEIAPERIAFLHLDLNSPRAETGSARGPARPRLAGRHHHFRRLRLEALSKSQRGHRSLHGGTRPGHHGTADRPRFDDQALAVSSIRTAPARRAAAAAGRRAKSTMARP